MITVAVLLRLGLPKVLEFMEFQDGIELAQFMYEQGLQTLEDLAEALCDNTVLCPYCGDNLAHIDNGLCADCVDHYNHMQARE